MTWKCIAVVWIAFVICAPAKATPTIDSQSWAQIDKPFFKTVQSSDWKRRGYLAYGHRRADLRASNRQRGSYRWSHQRARLRFRSVQDYRTQQRYRRWGTRERTSWVQKNARNDWTYRERLKHRRNGSRGTPNNNGYPKQADAWKHRRYGSNRPPKEPYPEEAKKDVWKHRRYGSRINPGDPYPKKDHANRWPHRRYGSRLVYPPVLPPPLPVDPPVATVEPVYPNYPQRYIPQSRTTQFLQPPMPPAPPVPPSQTRVRPPASSPVLALTQNKRYREREILVTVSSNSQESIRQDIANTYQSDVREIGIVRLIEARLLHVTLPEGQTVEEALPIFFQDSRILSAQPNYVYEGVQTVQKQSMQRNPQATPLYSLAALQIPETQDFPVGNGVIVAVIDTCLDATHPELEGAVASFFDAMPTRASQCEAEDHGTAIGGLIGGRSSVRGVAPKATLITARAFGVNPQTGQVEGTSEAIIRSLDWATQQRAQIMNMSFAGPRDPLTERAVTSVHRRGIIMIAAAGNAGPNSPPLYPAAYPEVIAVTAIDGQQKLYGSANTGPHIAVSAPGVDVIVARPFGAYDVDSGTSLAAATISGVTALMIEKRPKARPDQIRAALQQTAVHQMGRQKKDNLFGFGLVDAKAATSFVEANVSK